ncbi:hypothetical protein [Gordonia iterans]
MRQGAAGGERGRQTGGELVRHGCPQPQRAVGGVLARAGGGRVVEHHSEVVESVMQRPGQYARAARVDQGGDLQDGVLDVDPGVEGPIAEGAIGAVDHVCGGEAALPAGDRPGDRVDGPQSALEQPEAIGAGHGAGGRGEGGGRGRA